MANTKSAKKMIQVAARKRVRNQSVRSALKTFIKKAEQTIFSNKANSEEAAQAAIRAISALDKAAQKKVIHANNAARRKSRLVKKLNENVQQASI